METFPQHVKRLQLGKGWSRARLISEASGYKVKGTAPETIRNAVDERRGRLWPSQVAIEAIARALGVHPNEFTVYRIQKARERLDPNVVGLASALANADVLLSRPIPEDLAEEAARQREATNPGDAPSAPQRTQRGPEA